MNRSYMRCMKKFYSLNVLRKLDKLYISDNLNTHHFKEGSSNITRFCLSTRKVNFGGCTNSYLHRL